jgi:hypothetical protein
MARSVTCEVLTGKGWTIMTVEDYLQLNESGGRCPECKNTIRAHKLSVNGMAAHFEHRQASPSCSLADHR